MNGRWATPRKISVGISIVFFVVLAVIAAVAGIWWLTGVALAFAALQLVAMIVGFNPG